MSEDRLTEDDLKRIIAGEYGENEARNMEALERASREILALRDRIAKFEKERKAVMAKIREEINALDNHCCQGALFTILDFIRNPKEAADD